MTPYSTPATSDTPALVIYLLDVSASMSLPIGGRRRIDLVTEVLTATLRQMVYRSTQGGRFTPRYRLAMYAYSDDVYDLLGGVKPLEDVAQRGVPEMRTQRTTETAKAFSRAEELLTGELPRLDRCPAPLVCHLTDGEFTGDDPAPIVRRLMNCSVPDGAVLVENIFISEHLLPEPISDPTLWPGILPDTPLNSEYAHMLRQMSSPLPETYSSTLRENRFDLTSGSLMLFPGTSLDLIALGFQTAASTPVR